MGEQKGSRGAGAIRKGEGEVRAFARRERTKTKELTCPMTMGPAPRIIMLLISVLFLMAAPVFQASKRGGAEAVAGAAAGGEGERRGWGAFLAAAA